MARKRNPPVKKELLKKSREAALNAVQSFNNPLTTFKTETFIVLMIIAWTYLLHAYYRSQKIEYRYYDQGPQKRRFKRDKSTGAFRYWELKQCLNESACPLDKPTQNNLLFLVGLRNEIEHHQSTGVDERLSGRYLPCCLNYERYICRLFGEQYSLGTMAAFTLQFRDLTAVTSKKESVAPLPSQVAKYLQKFEADMSDEEISSVHYQRRLLFVPLLVNKKAQADEMIEFLPYDSEIAKVINEQYQQILIKEVERSKHLPSAIVKKMNEEGYPRFSMHNHTMLWKKLDAKNPGKGYGIQIANQWYWYDRWIEEVREHCFSQREKYGPA